MNFGEYLKKITGIESNQIQGEHPTKSDLSHIEADYTESSLFTSQQDSEAGDVDNIFGVMRSDEIEQLDFNKILKQPKSDDKDDADNADEENLSGRELALREFFNIDAVKEAADTDGNGEVSAEEAAAYLNGIIDKDGNSEELSIEDFNKIIEELGVVFTPMVDENGEPVLDDNGEMIPEPVSSVETAIAAQSPSAPTRSYGGNYHPSRPGEKIPTLAEMEEEKTRLESVVSEKQAAVDAVNNGQNEKVKEAQAKADEAKAARDEAISKDDIPSRYKKSLNETEEEIAANKASLDQNAINISHLQSDIENKEHAISSMNTSLSGLETSLSSLPQPTGAEADREKDAEIAQKKTSIENQIKDKKAEIEEENKKLEELKANLEKLNNEKAELEEKQTKLEQNKQDVEQKIEKNCSAQTKAAIENYNNAQNNVKQVKDSELKAATEALQTAKADLNAITEKIDRAKDLKTAFENGINTDGETMLEFAAQFVGKTQDEMRQIMRERGYQFDTNLWCADFVSFVTGCALGEDNLPDWYKNCNRAYCPSVENEARRNGAIISERTTPGGPIDTSNVKPGDYVIFNWERDGSRVDHIGYVERIEGNKVYTLEGNADGGVTRKVRDLSLVHSFVNMSKR